MKDVSEEIIINAMMHTLKILTAVQKGIIFLGRNDHLNNDENKEKEEEKRMKIIQILKRTKMSQIKKKMTKAENLKKIKKK